MVSHELTHYATRLGQVFRIGLRAPGVVVRTDVIWDKSVGVGTLVVWMDDVVPPAPSSGKEERKDDVGNLRKSDDFLK